jgi:methylenetetrahydrofolate dehydrogenase (NAD+)
MGEVIDVSALANAFREEIRAKIGGMKGAPLVVGFLGNDDPEARKYANMTKRACEKDGIRFEVRQVGRTDLEDALYDAVRDSNVHGIMIYYPAFGNKPSFYGGTMDDYLRDSVIAQKDIEGLCFTYRYNLYHNIRYMDEEKTKKCVLPCTALSIAKILEWIGIYDLALVQGERLRGKKVTIFNRSEIVGRPLAAMLANDGRFFCRV